MTYLLLTFFVTFILTSRTTGLSLDVNHPDNSMYNDGERMTSEKSEAVGRFLFLPTTNAGLNLNATILAALISALASSFLSLLTLTGTGLLMASNMKMKKKEVHYHVSSGGYGTTSSHGPSSHGSSYSDSSYRRMLMDPLNLDWETVTLVDWMALVQEIWEDFDTSDLECQKKLICDVHRNIDELGPVAKSLVHYFGYLHYGELFRLPSTMKEMLGELLNAADIGKSMKDCDDEFPGCNFSVKEAIKKYSPDTTDEGEQKDQEHYHDQNHIY